MIVRRPTEQCFFNRVVHLGLELQASWGASTVLLHVLNLQQLTDKTDKRVNMPGSPTHAMNTCNEHMQ